MSAGVDLSEFYDTFFDEADELLANMEQLLLSLDLENPDSDDLNGIFRAAHSIKGGPGPSAASRNWPRRPICWRTSWT